MAQRNKDMISQAWARNRSLLVGTFIFSVFANILMLTGPLFMLQIYDRVLGSRSEETLVAMFGLVALLFLFFGLLEFARGRVMSRVGARFQSELGPNLFMAVLERSARYRGMPEGKTALADLQAVRNFLTSPVFFALMDMPWTPVFLVAIFIFHPMLGWLAVFGGGLLILSAFLNQLMTQKRVGEAQARALASDRFSKQVESGSELIWAQGMGPHMQTRWARMMEDGLAKTINANDWTGGFSAFTKSFRLFLQSAMLALGAWLVLQNEVTPGAMIASSIMLGRALAPVEQALNQWPVAQRARSGMQNLRAFLNRLPDTEDPTRLPDPKAMLSAQSVTVVGRAGEKPVLNAVSLVVPAGQALGVIGKSGSGKSTIARVLTGLLEPRAGEVRLGGATLQQYGPERLGDLIGYLPQDVMLFDGTVAENIAHMSLNPDSDKVVRAAKRARIHDIILGLPDGYDSVVSAGSLQLSGGQKQRLALARALYNDPTVLILDEPNSALDADGSDALNAAVNEMKAEMKSVVIMTHRPAAIQTCETLVVVDGGRVVAQGPRDEVLQSMVRNAKEIQRVVGGANT